jgi:hypothetical protein
MNSSARVRFTTIKDLLGAFPTAAAEVGVESSDEPTLDFLRRSVAAGDFRAAISLCAYLLARREAVWWACGCLRPLEPRAPGESRCLDLAEDWVRVPEEEQRRAALDMGLQSSRKLPATWVALGAGWSGGNMSSSDTYRIAPAPQLTAQAVRGALLIAAATPPAEASKARQKEWIGAATRLLLGESLQR